MFNMRLKNKEKYRVIKSIKKGYSQRQIAKHAHLFLKKICDIRTWNEGDAAYNNKNKKCLDVQT